MAQSLLHHFRVLTLQEQLRFAGVSKIMKADVGHSCLLDEWLPPPIEKVALPQIIALQVTENGAALVPFPSEPAPESGLTEGPLPDDWPPKINGSATGFRLEV